MTTYSSWSNCEDCGFHGLMDFHTREDEDYEDKDALAGAKLETNILDDLKVNSARLVDVILEFEDEFEIEVEDEDADSVNTIGDAVDLIAAKVG